MGKERNQISAASSGRKDQEPNTVHNGCHNANTETNANPHTDRSTVTNKSNQPMHSEPTHAQTESLHKCSTGHWIACTDPPRARNTRMTPGVTSGATQRIS